MKRRGTCTTQGGGRRNKHTRGTNKKNKISPPPPPPPVLGTVATRTRRQQQKNASTWNSPVSILINILTYADPETIRQACCVSTQFRDLIYHDPGMAKNRVVPLLEIRPSEDKGDDDNEDRLGRLVQQLYHRQNKLQRYVTLTMIDPDKFKLCNLSTIDTMTEQLRLNGIVSFEMVGDCHSYCEIVHFFLSNILPNLQEINLSNTGSQYSALSALSTRCTRLEKVTWNNVNISSIVKINGTDIRSATNLREIYMDESSFFTRSGEDENFSDLMNSPDLFLLHKCGTLPDSYPVRVLPNSTVLERVSIRNAKWYRNGCFGIEGSIIIPQNALIKFVRNAPKSLRWFRSNLTTENMTMLRLERPEIELVN